MLVLAVVAFAPAATHQPALAAAPEPASAVASQPAHRGVPAVPVRVHAAAIQPPSVTIDAVGDVMLGWGVSALVRTKSPDAPFAHVRDILMRADAVVGNLECALSDRGVPTKAKPAKLVNAHKEFLLRGSPAAAAGLVHAGFAAMTLANNHTLDYGPDALRDTWSALRANGIATAGAGDNAAQAWAPAYFVRRGVRFAMIGVSEVIPRGFGAGKRTPGIAPGRDPSTGEIDAEYLSVLAHAVRMARKNADVVILYEHWGKELVGAPLHDHVRLAHAAIDAGATLVLGAHPHVLGPIEAYHGGLIAYSLGNFVFDTQPGAQTRSAVLEITLRGGAVTSWRGVPVIIKNGVPTPAYGSDAAQVARMLAGYDVQPIAAPVIRAKAITIAGAHGPQP